MCASVHVCAVCERVCCVLFALSCQSSTLFTCDTLPENGAKIMLNQLLMNDLKKQRKTGIHIKGMAVCVCVYEAQLTLPNKQQHSKKAKKQNKTTKNQNNVKKSKQTLHRAQHTTRTLPRL